MNALLDLDQLRTFIAIAETGSFTKAAEQVNKTQSAVSMQMRRLEERVGQPIFARDGRQSRVTDAGVRLLDYARRMLSLNAETFAAFSSDGMSGKVRLGLPDDYAPRLLPTVLASFATTHPNIEIEVVCEQSSCIYRRIKDGRLDLGIVTHGDSIAERNGRIIRSEPLLWVSSAHHSVHCQTTIPLALGTKTCSWRQRATEALSKAEKKYRIAYVSSSAAAATGAVMAGLAVAVLPESALTSDMRVLGAREGFPELRNCNIALIRCESAKDRIHTALAAHIVNALDNVSGSSLAAE
ncbi:DNA-binding transcriptional regulator, LysR family [Cohaesibacter sp. ES.047]|uniref:LysR substrate-binding domain-containing protein n=1 Tax=Cohaesibacter sp. ES.047 TaxID=1798205 RepID=UPI000BB74681|nr:LysR substrate-binding domain-containing protein [Cohaesibacter sp. ES.047]SNY92072.1 DNA-binding transcriptional regulator, LysR family [Cohaesibacter sp. ES.047]